MKKLLLIGLATLTLSSTTNELFKATYYHDKYIGRKTADASIFRQEKLTAACNTVPLGVNLKVTNIKNNKSVQVKVTDRLNKKYSNRVDLSKSAFKQIASLEEGIVNVKVERL